MIVLEKVTYETLVNGISILSGDKVEVIGEQTVELEDGRIVEQYLYELVGYTSEQPFVSLKSNIIIR